MSHWRLKVGCCCFGLLTFMVNLFQLNNIKEYDSICDTCVLSLRDSLQFKLKVLNSEKELIQIIKNKEPGMYLYFFKPSKYCIV